MIKKVVSGGQTGADRAGLDAALELKLPHGGWCPKGRKAEDGTMPSHYIQQETKYSGYKVRTEWSIRDSDGTLIIKEGDLQGGTLKTARDARRTLKPLFIISLDARNPTKETKDFVQWVRSNKIEVLNVAGPRESKIPGIQERAKQVLVGLIKNVNSKFF